MSFDLYFYSRRERPRIKEELSDYFQDKPRCRVCDPYRGRERRMVQYEHPHTGVRFWIEYAGPLSVEEGLKIEATDLVDTQVTFTMNVCRPSFFGREAFPVVEAFCRDMELLVYDPQRKTKVSKEDGPTECAAEELLASWNRVNAWAIRVMPGPPRPYLPLDLTERFWNYQRQVDEMQKHFEDVDVCVAPMMLLVHRKHDRVLTVATWPDGIRSALPACDYFLLSIKPANEKRKMREPMGLAPYSDVIRPIKELVRTDNALPEGTFLVLGENEGKIIEIYKTYQTESMQGFRGVTGDDIVDMNPVEISKEDS